MTNWSGLACHLDDKRCQEHRRYGKCSCRVGKNKQNPCNRHRECAASCEALADGETPSVSVDEIVKWTRKHTCYVSQAGKECNHRGCGRAEDLLATVAQRKAA